MDVIHTPIFSEKKINVANSEAGLVLKQNTDGEIILDSIWLFMNFKHFLFLGKLIHTFFSMRKMVSLVPYRHRRYIKLHNQSALLLINSLESLYFVRKHIPFSKMH